MRLRSILTLSAALAATIIASGCSMESPAAPQTPSASPLAPAAPSMSLLSSPMNVTPLKRKTPLATSITVTKTIGILGGTLSIPAAGVTVVVPPLAVASPTSFSMTARAGSAVEYDFAPHGLHFTLPLVMTQNLTNMTGGPALLGALQLGYYADANHPTTVSELLNVNLDVLHLIGVSTIWHFSGYIFMTGRAAAEEE